MRLQSYGGVGGGYSNTTSTRGMGHHQHGDSWSKTQPLPPLSDDGYREEKGGKKTSWFRRLRLKCW